MTAPAPEHGAAPSPVDTTGGVNAVWSDAMLLVGRNLNLLRRTSASLASMTVFPIIFLLGFFAVLSRSMERFGIDYQQFLPPIVVIQSMFFTAIGSAFFLADDRASGMMDRLRSLPIAPEALILGRGGADLARALVSMVVVLVVAMAMGFRFEAGILAAVGFVGIVMLFAVTATTGCALVGLTAADAEAASSTLFLPYLPLLMLSTGFVPLSGFPGWIRPFVEWQPVSLSVDALRALSSGGPTLVPVIEAVVGLGLLLVLFVALTVRVFRRLA